MPREAPPSPARPTDPRRVLTDSPLAGHLDPAPDGRSAATAEIQRRDPRARLDAAAAQLHGGRSDLLPAAPGTAPDVGEGAPQRRRSSVL